MKKTIKIKKRKEILGLSNNPLIHSKKDNENLQFSNLFLLHCKKGFEINQQIIMSILSVLLIVLLFIFALRSCSSLSEKQRGLILSDLEGDMQSTAELLSPKYGSVQHKEFMLPAGTDTVCFLDLNHSNTILYNTSLPVEYPIINKSLSVKDKKNVFLIKDSLVTDTLYGGNICFDYYPFYSCLATKGDVLDVWFESRAGCVTLYINWSAFPENFKNMTQYNTSPLFLIQEQRPGVDVTNWREISAVVPLALFQENRTTPPTKVYSYNYSIFYKKGAVSDQNISYLMNNIYHAKSAYIFDNPVSFTVENLTTKSTQNLSYFDFWKNYSSIILIKRDNTASALIGSLLAAYVNTPLIFIDQSNLDMYKPVIAKKQIFIVRHGPVVLDDVTYNYVKNNAARYQEIYDSMLQSEGTVYVFAKLYSTMVIK